MSSKRSMLASVSMLASLAVYSASIKGAPAPLVRIPFVVGLTTVRAVVTPKGDYESVRVVDLIDANHYRISLSSQVPADDGNGIVDLNVTREVSGEDQRDARKIRLYFHSSDPGKFPGTVPGFSKAVVNELRTAGKAAVTYQDVQTFFGMTNTREFKGMLTRVPGAATIPMLVNGHVVALPVLHTQGALSDGSETKTIELDVIDDPENPIVLRFKGPGASTQVIRIEYPEAKQAPDSIESKLAKNEPALVYGIYFDFAKADIRKESDRVLKEIAAILREHADWKLRIDGHTDNVGNNAANLDLSKRRAAEVKDALVTRFKIDASRLATGGYGESSPKDTNETPEGRARNRRVELRRE